MPGFITTRSFSLFNTGNHWSVLLQCICWLWLASLSHHKNWCATHMHKWKLTCEFCSSIHPDIPCAETSLQGLQDCMYLARHQNWMLPMRSHAQETKSQALNWWIKLPESRLKQIPGPCHAGKWLDPHFCLHPCLFLFPAKETITITILLVACFMWESWCYIIESLPRSYNLDNIWFELCTHTVCTSPHLSIRLLYTDKYAVEIDTCMRTRLCSQGARKYCVRSCIDQWSHVDAWFPEEHLIEGALSPQAHIDISATYPHLCKSSAE